MLIHRNALEVVRACNKAADDEAPVTTHVFVDEGGLVTATNGSIAIRAKGFVNEEPTLFMADVVGVDEIANHALPRDMVIDFLKAWGGDQIVVREDGAGALLETVDGQTSRRFESKAGRLDAPNFASVIKTPKGPRAVVVSVEFLLIIARTLKAMGATSVRLSIGQDESPIYFESKALIGEALMEVDGALMPMREAKPPEEPKLAEATV